MTGHILYLIITSKSYLLSKHRRWIQVMVKCYITRRKFIYLFITFGGNQENPNSAKCIEFKGRLHEMRLETDLFKKSSFRCRRENRRTRRKVWTGNQMHIRRRDWESNQGPLVHSAGEEPLRYLLPQNKMWKVCHIHKTRIILPDEPIFTLQLFKDHAYITRKWILAEYIISKEVFVHHTINNAQILETEFCHFGAELLNKSYCESCRSFLFNVKMHVKHIIKISCLLLL